MTTTLVVNGVTHEVRSGSDRSLLSVLREELGITGPKYGCGEGACGACAVQLGDRVVASCRTRLEEVGERPVTTVEGLARDGRLHPVQQAWLEEGALQCGFCTPGWLVSAAAMMSRQPRPDEAQIMEHLEYHLCRCCTYPRIRRAVRRAIELTDHPEPMRPDLAAAVAAVLGESGAATAGAPGGAESEVGSAGTADPPLDVGPDDGPRLFDVLGDGLLVVAGPPAEHRGWGVPPGAWVHVADSGRVTAGIGKVEAGQGTRSALALLIAEELCVPYASVRLVMGDTGASPWDMGTFGSRSMPDAGPQVRAAAAAARESLREAAADHLGVAATTVTLQDAAATVQGSDRTLTYGELLRGARRTEHAPGEVSLTSAGSWRTAGQRAVAQGAVEAVLARKRYPSDLSRPGMLHGAVLRAPAYGARLRSLGTRAAEAISGVTVVRDGELTGVVAPEPETARRAAEALDSAWDLSAQPSAAELEGYLRAHPVEADGWTGPVRQEEGEPDRALAEGEVRLDATYQTAYIAHTPMEPRCALAEWREGTVTVWTGAQTPFNVRSIIAEALGLKDGDVRVVVPDFGGGFGGKHGATVAVEAARLARAAGRPVKLQWSRAEEFSWGHLRPAAVIDVAASTREGRLTAWSMININSGPMALLTPYTVASWRIAFQPTASPLPQGSYRALSATANNFARESHMDALARRLGVEPLDFRLRHLDDQRLASVLSAAAGRIGWQSPRPGTPGYGRGIAGGIEKGGRVATAAEVVVGPDRELRVTRLVTAFDCGAIVNPDNLANQVEGATVMALGGALFERIDFAGGRILNGSLDAYRVPRLADVPEVEVVLLDQPGEASAGGGETPLIAVAPAIANAIADACGVRLRTMPLAPDGTIPEAEP